MAAGIEIIDWANITEEANLEELKYRQEIQDYDEDHVKAWMDQKQLLKIILALRREGITFEGRIAELGAGHCWLAAELSKLEDVEHIYAVEFSRRMLEENAVKTIEYLRGIFDKISLVVGDFHDLKFEDKSLDMILFDASLHHVRDYPKVLGECHRCLRDGGRIVAPREAYLLPFRNYMQKGDVVIKRTKDELWSVDKDNITENKFSKRGYRNLLAKHGFRARIKPYFIPKGKFGIEFPAWFQAYSPLRFLNGYFYCTLCIEAVKR